MPQHSSSSALFQAGLKWVFANANVGFTIFTAGIGFDMTQCDVIATCCIEVFSCLGLYCISCASWKWLLVFSLALSSPRLLWQPGSGHPAEGTRYVLALGVYWNIVMASCFASPLLILRCCWSQPLLILPTLLYVVWARFISRAELKDGAAWPWFSQQEWGYHVSWLLMCLKN